MRLLLDTHALLWALSAPARLPKAVSDAVRDPGNAVYVSAASTWEIAIKVAIGKIRADLDEIARAVGSAGFEELSISVGHTRAVRHLPAHHRDPFDRILVAQALEEGLTVVTRDAALAAYRVPTMWG